MTAAVVEEDRSGRYAAYATVRQQARRVFAVVCAPAVVVVCVLGVCSSAVAARAHGFSFVFGGSGSGAGELSLARPVAVGESGGSGVAVDDVTGDVFVADTGNRRVDEFEPVGSVAAPTGYSFVRAWGWGVASGAEEFQVCVSSCRVGSLGSAPGEFEEPAYVAVDNDASSPSVGDVYVGDTGDQLVSKFTSAGVLVSSWGNNGENAAHQRVEPDGQLNGSPTELFDAGIITSPMDGVAVDGSGDLWVLVNADSKLFSFDQAGGSLSACAHKVFGPSMGGLGAAGAGVLYALGSGEVYRLTGCTNEGMVAAPHGLSVHGLAVDVFDGDLYVDAGGLFVEDIPARCVPSSFGCPVTQVFGEEQLSEASGVGVDPGSGMVYVANAKTDQIVGFGLTLEATVAAADGVVAHGAVLHGAVNPVGAELTRCQFEVGDTTSQLESGELSVEYGSSVPCEETLGSIGKGNAPVEVHASVAGLDGGKTYHFRLHATSANGSVFSEDQHFQTSPTAKIIGVSTSELTGSSGLLKGRVNPEGMLAHYHFQYGPCDSVAVCPQAPYTESSPEGTIPAGNSTVEVSQHVEGLSPGTTYHYQIVVEDTNGVATPSPEGTFVYEPSSPECHGQSSVLPDCRAYEMVTPPVKNAALIANGAFMTPPAVAENGSRVLMSSIQCFNSAPSCLGVRESEGQVYSFERTAPGWVTIPLAPASPYSTQLGYDADTDMVLYALAAPAPGLEEFYAREPDGSLDPIGPLGEHPGIAVGDVLRENVDMTADFSRVVYEAGLWPSLELGRKVGKNIFEYSGRKDTAPVLVDVTGPVGSTSLLGSCGAKIGRDGGLSFDGRTVYVTVNACSTGVTVPADEVFARIEGAHGMETVLVSGPGPESVCDVACRAQPTGGAKFEGASEDGSRAVFTSTQQLTDSASEDKRSGDDAAEGGCSNTSVSASGCNLYEFECPDHCESLSARRLIDLSAGDSSGVGPQVQGVMAISPNGSDAYYVAHGVLSDTPNQDGQLPVVGANNLYVSSDEGHTEFIATLAPTDALQWDNLGERVANVSPDGRFLVFTSHRGLTRDATGGEGPAQVYRYDLQDKELTRVSIGEQGFDDNGNAAIAGARIVEAFLGVSTDGPHRSDPSMSDDGQHVFFQSPTGLTSTALNDHPVTGNPNVLAENVYEWAADGAHYGEGTEATPPCDQQGGCISLISDGRDVNEGTGSRGENNTSAVELLGVDATGENVFFWTADQLVAADTDTQVDLYDARVNGGFPTPPPPPACEDGETLTGGTCRGQGSTSSVFTAPASVSFSGPPNTNTVITVGTKPNGKSAPVRLTRAQKLKQALAACHKERSRSSRSACEKKARKRYGKVKRAASGRHGR
jgi:hypothetical protein